MNPTVGNKEALDIQSQECTSLINESKDRYIAKMSAKSKTYWSIINKFLNNKKIPSYHLFLIKVNQYQILNKKVISSTIIFPLYVLLLKMVANYRALVIKLKKD